ncbi:hypothetical protein Tco_0688172 [Tanacetum coccineum]
MGTKVTSSSGSVLKEPEIQKLQMQAKIFKENSLNKLNALKSTTQLLERQTFSGCILYQQAFAQLFGDSVRTFKFQLSQHMNNLETLLNAETLHEMDSKSALSVIKVQFESSNIQGKQSIQNNMNTIEQCIIERSSHEQELKMTLKKLSERQLQIQQCKVQEVQSLKSLTLAESSSTDTPLEQVKEEKDIDKMIEMDKQLKFLNEIVYTRNQSIQTIHMLAPKCATYNGRLTFANPRYLKKAQSEKPCLYEIPYDNSDHANRFSPEREETMTLENESRSKLNKDKVKPYIDTNP